MQVRVHFFGRLADRLGREAEVDLPANGSTIADLRARLTETRPEAAGLAGGRIRACVGDSIVGDEFRLGPDDVVEFFPPLSGG